MNSKPLQHEWIEASEGDLGGRWIGSDGVTLCEWNWTTRTKTLRIFVDGIENSSRFEMDDHLVHIQRLKEVLPDISRHNADRIIRKQRSKVLRRG